MAGGGRLTVAGAGGRMLSAIPGWGLRGSSVPMTRQRQYMARLFCGGVRCAPNTTRIMAGPLAYKDEAMKAKRKPMVRVRMRFDPDVTAWIRQGAKREGKSISAFVRERLAEAIAELTAKRATA